MFAVWRCRCIRVRGFNHAGSDDFTRHLRQLVEDPWIKGDQTSTKSERRAARMQPPPAMPNYIVYNSDGASRSPPNADRVGSLGACLRVNDQILARFASYLGNVTNNIAEYEGALACLEHAMSVNHAYFCFRLDSMLVVKQFSGEWACRSVDLQPLYEHGLMFFKHCVTGPMSLTCLLRMYIGISMRRL